MENYLFFIFIIVILGSLGHTMKKQEEKMKEKINFLWERYLLFQLYLQYNEQQSEGYPKDICQSLYKIDFDKLPYHTKIMKNFYFSLKPIDYGLSPEIIKKLYELDKLKSQKLEDLESLNKYSLEKIIKEGQNKKINIFKEIRKNPVLNNIDLMKDLLVLEGLSNLYSLQEVWMNKESDGCNNSIEQISAHTAKHTE